MKRSFVLALSSAVLWAPVADAKQPAPLKMPTAKSAAMRYLDAERRAIDGEWSALDYCSRRSRRTVDCDGIVAFKACDAGGWDGGVTEHDLFAGCAAPKVEQRYVLLRVVRRGKDLRVRERYG